VFLVMFWSRMSSCAFVHFPWVTCAVDSRRVSYALRLVTLVADVECAFVLFSPVSLVQWNSRWVNYVLRLVTVGRGC
jgi:hypothetical protein